MQLYSRDVRYDPKAGRCQMWYEGHPGSVLLCTAFSKDGLHWEKPSLDLQEWKGSKQNNIVLQTGYTDAHCASIVKGADGEGPARKYKLYFWVAPEWMNSHIEPMELKPDRSPMPGARSSRSSERAITWLFRRTASTLPPRTEAVLETADFNAALFDEQLGRYRSYHKIEHRLPGWSQFRRCLWESESDDGLTFGKSRLVLAPDEANDVPAKAAYGADRFEFCGAHVWPQDGSTWACYGASP